ncbi:MAG TPA: hydroxyacid dehydrogenase, partial [Polyangia bacterium]
MPRPPSLETLTQLRNVVGPAGVVSDPAEVAPYLREWRNRWIGETPLLLCPATPNEVAAIVGICAAAEVGVVP